MIERLLQNFAPEHYKLHLNIDAKNSEFTGAVSIKGQLQEASPFIRLHAKDLKFIAARFNGQEINKFVEKEFDVVELQCKETQPVGNAEVIIEFRGKVTDAMHGMYPCYFEHDGVRKKLIATQFESHHAREVFPCIDEPAAKATFDLSLVTDEGEVVLSNTPVKDTASSAQRTTTTFETTPRMSTYLLAFVFGEMHAKEAVTKNGVVVKSWATVAQDASWLEYSVSEAVSYLEFYEKFFGVPYPLEKCDQVALPDFESGAMENWGLITYRETVLLSNPENPSLSTKQLIAIVVAHELSHQWFGNLVTMQWWDDLWLNESFASVTEYMAVDDLHPDWQMWEEYIGQDAVSATNRDVYSDVQPVKVVVDDPAEIHTLFDPAIVYAKGGKLLKALYDLVGETAWRAGLKDYFTEHAYKNTTRDDLWTSLSKHSDFQIAELMNGWLEHAGQPLITVSQTSKKVILAQKRLLLDNKNDDTTWQVPLLTEPSLGLLTKKSEELELKSDNWIQLNTTGVGHYVTNYTNPEHKDWIAKKIVDPKQPSGWKIARLNELTMLAKHGDTTLTESLDAITGSSSEERAMVWSLIAGILGSARHLTEGNEETEASLKTLAFNLVSDQYLKLGWEYPTDEESNMTHLRSIILGLALSSENDIVVQKAIELYRATKNPETLPAELRGLLMSTAVRFGTESEFNKLVEYYKTSQNAEFKSDICSALTSARRESYIKMLLQNLKDTNIVRTQDTIRWYAYLMRNRYSREAAWQWLTNNWDWILENFGSSKSYDDFARYSASFINTHTWLSNYEAFFSPMKDDPALKRTILIGIDEITARAAWRNRDESVVTQWLAEYSAKNS